MSFDLDELHRRYPWPPDIPTHRPPLEYLWRWDLPVSVSRIWPHLSDTSRFNRALGLARMDFEERDGVLYGSAVVGGLAHEWIEIPWQWVAERYLIGARQYSRGYQVYTRVIYHLIPGDELPDADDDAVRLFAYFGLIPRGTFSSWAIKLGMKSLRRQYDQAIGELARHLETSQATPFHEAPPPLSEDAQSRIASIRRALADDLDVGDAIDRLVELIRSGDDMDLHRLQLRRLAREWGVDDAALMRLALHATRAGLLELSWDVTCPHCRGVREEARTLGDVPRRGECGPCGIDFDTDRENTVEVSFRVHPAVREVPRLWFCSAEPAKKPHIALQQFVGGGTTRLVETALGPGRYRMRLHRQTRYRLLDVRSDADLPTDHVWTAGGEMVDEVLVLGTRPTLELANPGAEEVGFIIEECAWSELALRPRDLFNFQEFRDLFSDEYLGVDVQLALGEQTILFTDMVGSTKFYAACGDPEAFSQVKRHFVELFEEVGNHRGAVVKTIGDAAMASFANPVDALRCSRAILERFPAGREDCPIRLRISLNTGACIAVNLNSAIDYFGGTVNVAAKLQACAEAGEVALSQAVLESPGVREFLDAEKIELHQLEFEIQALGETVPVYRWDVN